jgi:hypothetical protein
MRQPRTGVEIIAGAYRNSYDRDKTLRLALGCQGSVIGQWMPALDRFYPIASETITGEWVMMPYEILANGKAPDYQWVEITKQPMIPVSIGN